MYDKKKKPPISPVQRRRSGRVIIVLGFVLALIAGVGAFVVFSNDRAQPVQSPTTRLVVAFQSIAQYSEITTDQVGEVDWPLQVPTPTGAFPSAADVAGKIALVPFYPAQPILLQTIVDKGQLKETHSNAALVLEKGMTAAAFPVTMLSDVAQALQAGDHVDIVATFTAPPPSTNSQPAGNDNVASQLLLQDVLVIQVGPWPNPEGAPPASPAITVVTMQVNQQDAAVLTFAEQRANNIKLILRASTDHDPVTVEPVTMEYLNRRFGYKFPSVGQ